MSYIDSAIHSLFSMSSVRWTRIEAKEVSMEELPSTQRVEGCWRLISIQWFLQSSCFFLRKYLWTKWSLLTVFTDLDHLLCRKHRFRAHSVDFMFWNVYLNSTLFFQTFLHVSWGFCYPQKCILAKFSLVWHCCWKKKNCTWTTVASKCQTACCSYFRNPPATTKQSSFNSTNLQCFLMTIHCIISSINRMSNKHGNNR